METAVGSAARSHEGGALEFKKYSRTGHSTRSDCRAGRLVPCPHCGRTFAPKVAERHIPKCKNIKAKPKTLVRGSGHIAVSKAAIRKAAQSGDSQRHSWQANASAPSSPGSPHLASSNRSTALAAGRVPVARSGVVRMRCQFCGREFGKKAFARHVEHCSKVYQEKQMRKFDTSLKSNANIRSPHGRAHRARKSRGGGRRGPRKGHGEIYSSQSASATSRSSPPMVGRPESRSHLRLHPSRKPSATITTDMATGMSMTIATISSSNFTMTTTLALHFKS